MYLQSKLYEIDLSDSQLSDEEYDSFVERSKAENCADELQRKDIGRKMRSGGWACGFPVGGSKR